MTPRDCRDGCGQPVEVARISGTKDRWVALDAQVVDDSRDPALWLLIRGMRGAPIAIRPDDRAALLADALHLSHDEALDRAYRSTEAHYEHAQVCPAAQARKDRVHLPGLTRPPEDSW